MTLKYQADILVYIPLFLFQFGYFTHAFYINFIICVREAWKKACDTTVLVYLVRNKANIPVPKKHQC